MTRISALSYEQAPAAARPMLEGVKAFAGFIPNLFSTMAHSPATLGAYLQLSQALSKGSLTAQEREKVALAISEVNDCGYCLRAHGLFAQKSGLTAEDIAAARKGEGGIASWLARRITESRGHLSDADLQFARREGLSDAKIIDVVGSVALLTLTNYVNSIARTEIDFPEL